MDSKIGIQIRLIRETAEKNLKEGPMPEPKNLVTPGYIITRDSGFMRGHGTYTDKVDTLRASTVGTVQRVDRLISVRTASARFQGEIGDVVVGRVVEVQQRRWKVDVNARLHAVLHLSSVNLPGGELRRRSAEDELAMREYLEEGDLVSAEIQSVHSDGTLSIHTRSLKYGKLGQGVLLKVRPSVIARRKNHFHSFPFGASAILGTNGYIWICPPTNAEDEVGTGGFVQNLDEPVPISEREVIARLRNCIAALAARCTPLYDTTITYAYEESGRYETKELLKPEIMEELANLVKTRMELEEMS